MNFIKKSLAVLFMALSVQAEVAIYNPTATAVAAVITQPARIAQVSFANAATNAITITMYDSPTNTTTWISGAYTNNVQTLSNVVTTFTNITGVVQSSTNSTLVMTPTAVGALTNSYRTVLVQTIPASSTITWTPPFNLNVGFGLAAATSATNVIATISYLPTR